MLSIITTRSIKQTKAPNSLLSTCARAATWLCKLLWAGVFVASRRLRYFVPHQQSQANRSPLFSGLLTGRKPGFEPGNGGSNPSQRGFYTPPLTLDFREGHDTRRILRGHRLTVRTSRFQRDNAGSNPVDPSINSPLRESVNGKPNGSKPLTLRSNRSSRATLLSSNGSGCLTVYQAIRVRIPLAGSF